MAEITPYQTQVSPQGRINTQASPEDFGSQVGASISNIGGAVAGIGADLYRREVEDEVTDVHIAMSDARRELAQMVESETNDAPPGDPRFVERVSGKIDTYFKGMSPRFTTREGVKAFGTMSSNMKGMFTYAAVETESRLAAIATKNGHTRVMDNLSTAAYDDFRQVPLLKQNLYDMINDPNSRYARVPAVTRESLLMEGNSAIDYQAAVGFATKYPGAIMETLQGEDAMSLREGYATATPSGKIPNLNASIVKPYDDSTVSSIRKKVVNTSPYDSMFESAGNLYNIDPKELKLRAVVESGLNPSASSSQGAMGIMQMTKETAASLGVDPMDPKSAIMGAAKLISTYRNKAGGDMSKVDLSYYGGESGTAWGPNTKQYAANMAAARLAVGLGSSMSPDEFSDQWDAKLGRELTTGVSVVDALPPDQRRRVVAIAHQAQEALESQARRSAIDAQTAKKERVESVKDSYLNRVFDPSFENGGPLDEREILRSPDLPISDKKDFIGMLAARSKELSSPESFKTDPRKEQELYAKLYPMDGGPSALSMPDVMGAYAAGKLSTSSMKALVSELKQGGPSVEKEYNANRDQLLGNVSQNLSLYPSSVEQAGIITDLRMQLNQHSSELVKKGEDPSSMFIPSSKNYYGVLPGISRTMQRFDSAFLSSAKDLVNQGSSNPEDLTAPLVTTKGRSLSYSGLDAEGIKRVASSLQKGDIIDGMLYLGGAKDDPKSYREAK